MYQNVFARRFQNLLSIYFLSYERDTKLEENFFASQNRIQKTYNGEKKFLPSLLSLGLFMNIRYYGIWILSK